MYQRILLPTDFSQLASDAAHYARGLAAVSGGEVHVIHVAAGVATPPPTPAAAHVCACPAPQAAQAAAQEALERFIGELFPDHPRRITSEVLLGNPAETICEYAQAQGVDTIVIGTHAAGLLTRIALGSVSKWVVENAPCPVLMVPVADEG